MFAVYILYSNSIKKYYTGQTNNIEERINRHCSGKVASTKRANDWELIWSTELKSRSEALILERKIKNKGAKRFLEAIGM